MDPRLQKRIQHYGWDKAASHYERYWQSQLAPAQRRLLERAELREREHVLDVACGTGLVSFAAAGSVGPRGRVLGVDISQRMIELARAQADALGWSWATFERMEAEDLRVDEGSFDAALCALGLMYVSDVPASLAAIHRALKPAGRFVAAVWGERSRCGWADIFPIVDARVKSEVCPLFFALGTADRLRTACEAAGFANVVSERITTSLEYATAEDALGAAFAGGPVALAYSRFDDSMRDEAHAEYLASIAPYRRGSGYAIPGEFVVTMGVAA